MKIHFNQFNTYVEFKIINQNLIVFSKLFKSTTLKHDFKFLLKLNHPKLCNHKNQLSRCNIRQINTKI